MTDNSYKFTFEKHEIFGWEIGSLSKPFKEYVLVAVNRHSNPIAYELYKERFGTLFQLIMEHPDLKLNRKVSELLDDYKNVHYVFTLSRDERRNVLESLIDELQKEII